MITKQTGFMQMSPQAFMALGVDDVAYLKPITRDGKALIAIHAADGTELTAVETRELAMAVVRQHDLEPLSAH